MDVYNLLDMFRMIAEVMIMREEEKKRTSQNSSLQRFFKKRWVFPAIYLASAAIILTGVLWFQSSGSNDLAEEEYNYSEDLPGTATNESEPAVTVNTSLENFAMPVLDEDAVEIYKQFYDTEASKEEQEAALVSYENTYYPNKGIDIVGKDGKSFDVTASLSGTVVRAAEDSLFGNIVEIEHAEGVITVYQSLSDVVVKQGDAVEQGQVIAKAGKNLFNKDAQTHVHFEVRNNGIAVNPLEIFEKPITSLEENESVSEEQPAEEETPAADEDTEKAPADEEKSEEDENTDASIGMATA